jgi:hypothetical protein
MNPFYKVLINALINDIVDWLTSSTQAALNWVLGLLSTTVFTSPNVTVLPQVTYIAGHAQLTANAFMVLIVMLVGIVAMTHGSVQERYSLKEMLPRVVIGFAAANLALPIVAAVIAGANAVTAAMVGDRFTSQDSFTQIQRVVIDTTTDPAMFLLALVLRELALWMLVLLVITWLGRLSVLLVVAGTAPLALMCHALAWTEPIAHIWWRSLFGCLAVQVLQAVTLHMAVATLLSSNANLPALGLPHDPTGLLNLLIACFLLWLVIRIPQWVGRTFGGNPGRGASLLGSVVRVVLVQQTLGALGLRGGRLLRRGAPAAAGMRSPASHLHSHAAASHQHAHQHQHQHQHVHPPRPGRPPGPGNSPPGPGHPPPGSGAPPRRAPYYAGQATTSAPYPGRRPRVVEGRLALPPAPPRAIGPGPGSAGGGPRPRPPAGRPPRPVRPYTVQELADGVDLYSRAVKRRGGPPPPRSHQ